MDDGHEGHDQSRSQRGARGAHAAYPMHRMYGEHAEHPMQHPMFRERERERAPEFEHDDHHHDSFSLREVSMLGSVYTNATNMSAEETRADARTTAPPAENAAYASTPSKSAPGLEPRADPPTAVFDARASHPSSWASSWAWSGPPEPPLSASSGRGMGLAAAAGRAGHDAPSRSSASPSASPLEPEVDEHESTHRRQQQYHEYQQFHHHQQQHQQRGQPHESGEDDSAGEIPAHDRHHYHYPHEREDDHARHAARRGSGAGGQSSDLDPLNPRRGHLGAGLGVGQAQRRQLAEMMEAEAETHTTSFLWAQPSAVPGTRPEGGDQIDAR